MDTAKELKEANENMPVAVKSNNMLSAQVMLSAGSVKLESTSKRLNIRAKLQGLETKLGVCHTRTETSSEPTSKKKEVNTVKLTTTLTP